MCHCGVWLRLNQSTLDRIREACAALKTPYFRTTVILSRVRKSGHNQWQIDHQKAMDANRGVQKRSKYTSILGRWHKDDVHRAFQGAIGWTETYVKYLDYISEIYISYHAPCRQRVRYDNTVYMRGVDSNKQAGPLSQRPGYKSSTQALVSLQQAQGKGVPHTPMKERPRHNDILDPAVRQHLGWLSFHWPEYFSSSSSSTWRESSRWWSSLRLDHQWQDWYTQGWQDKEWWDQQ